MRVLLAVAVGVAAALALTLTLVAVGTPSGETSPRPLLTTVPDHP
ncbi:MULTISPECIES: SPW_0924 family protein [unclassified Streptomyces]|nr:SPW_0924 family protein [Streptomyces sp. HSG2]